MSTGLKSKLTENDLLSEIEKAAEKGTLKARKKPFLTGLCTGILITLLLINLVPWLNVLGNIRNVFVEEETIQNQDAAYHMDIDNFTSVDFQEAILGAASKKAQLIVYEREVSDASSVDEWSLKTDIFGEKVKNLFKKTKTVTFKGTACYTVDLESLNSTDVKVDDQSKTITIYIPHANLLKDNIIVNREDITFSDTTKGKLAFGDIKLTSEQWTEIEKNAKNIMIQRLKDENEKETADDFAISMVEKLFQSVVSTMSSQYKVVVEFR